MLLLGNNQLWGHTTSITTHPSMFPFLLTALLKYDNQGTRVGKTFCDGNSKSQSYLTESFSSRQATLSLNIPSCLPHSRCGR